MSVNTYKFNREHIKKSDMISGYGAGKERISDQLKKDLKELYFEGVEDFFYQAIDNITPMVSLLKETFMTLWDDNRTDFRWTLPDGFVAQLKPNETVEITVNPFGQLPITMVAKAIVNTTKSTSLGVSIIHSVDGFIARELINRCNYDAKALKRLIIDIDEFILLNPEHTPTSYHDMISHAVMFRLVNDEEALSEYSIEQLRIIRNKCIKSLDYKPFPVKPIHDGFGSHPNHSRRMQEIHAEIKAELTASHLLESILMEISGKPFRKIVGDLKPEEVLLSKYTLC